MAAPADEEIMEPCARACLSIYNSRVNCDTLPTASHTVYIYCCCCCDQWGRMCPCHLGVSICGERGSLLICRIHRNNMCARTTFIPPPKVTILYRQTMETFLESRDILCHFIWATPIFLLSCYSLLRVGDVLKRRKTSTNDI